MKSILIILMLFFFCGVNSQSEFQTTEDLDTSSILLKKNEAYGFLRITKHDMFRFPTWGVGYSRLISRKYSLWGFTNYNHHNYNLGYWNARNRAFELGIKKHWTIIKEWPIEIVTQLAYARANWVLHTTLGDYLFVSDDKLDLLNGTVGFSYGRQFVIGLYHDVGYGRIAGMNKAYENGVLKSSEGGAYWGGAVVKEFYFQIGVRF